MSNRDLKTLFGIILCFGLLWWLFKTPQEHPVPEEDSTPEKNIVKNKWEKINSDVEENTSKQIVVKESLEPVFFTLWLKPKTILENRGDRAQLASEIKSVGFKRVMIEAVENDNNASLTWESKLLREHGHFYSSDLNLKQFISALHDQKIQTFADLTALASIATEQVNSSLKPILAEEIPDLISELGSEGYTGLGWEGANEILHTSVSLELHKNKMKYLPLNAVLPWHLDTNGIHVSSERSFSDMGLNTLLLSYAREKNTDLWLKLQVLDGYQDLPEYEWDHPAILANLMRFRAISSSPTGYVIAANPQNELENYQSPIEDVTSLTSKVREQKKPILNLVLDITKREDNTQMMAWFLWEASAPLVNTALALGYDLRISLTPILTAEVYFVITNGMAVDTNTGQFDPTRTRAISPPVIRLLGKNKQVFILSLSPFPDSEEPSWDRVRRTLGMDDTNFERLARTNTDLPRQISFEGFNLNWSKKDGVVDDNGEDSELVALTDVRPENFGENTKTFILNQGKNELVLWASNNNLSWINGNILDLNMWWFISKKIENTPATYLEPFDGWASTGNKWCAFFARDSTKLIVKPPFPDGTTFYSYYYDASGNLEKEEQTLSEGTFSHQMQYGEMIILELSGNPE